MLDIRKYDLECRYDSRNCFYGKAKIEEQTVTGPCGVTTIYSLFSYGTLVAKILYSDIDGKKIMKYLHMGKYSQTTSRHQREFFRQFGLTDAEIKILEKNVDKEIVFE